MSKKNIQIISHTDMDGYAAASIIAHYNDVCIEENCSEYEQDNLILVNYPKNFPVDKIREGAYVYITDTSFGPDTIKYLVEICEKAEKVVWIDHHRTSEVGIESLTEIPKNLLHLVETKYSATWLAYEFYNLGIEDSEFPKWIHYVDDHDCWKKKYELTNYFSNGMFDATISEYLRLLRSDYRDLDGITDEIIKKGMIIEKYAESLNQRNLSRAFEYEIEGIKTLCLNSIGNSKAFGEKINDYPMVCLFRYNGTDNRWNYSIYSVAIDGEQVDCSKIAQKFGGGGHPGASGFALDNLIFNI